jgi:cysteine desulfurase
MTRIVYMDYQATTPVDPGVLERMLPYFTDKFGNAASKSHPFGWEAEEAVEHARAKIAQLIGATAAEIVFTSGATESNNLALFGARAKSGARRHIVSQVTEHKAVLDVLKALPDTDVTLLGVDCQGRVEVSAVAAALRPDTALVTVMAANNEVGALQPIGEIGALCRERGILFHTDAAQAAGKLPLNVDQVDLMSLSAHKLYGPKGVGALYVRRKHPRVELQPLVLGGGHERGRRSGTLNVPGIVGFGAAAELAAADLTTEAGRLRELAEALLRKVREGIPDVVLNGPPIAERLPGNLNVAFPGVEVEALILSLRDVAVSSGSACTSATLEPSHVLRAMGLPSELLHGSLRLGIGRPTTGAEVDFVAAQLVEKVKKVRQLSPRAHAGISRT